MAIGMEIEKKYTVYELPEDLDQYDYHIIEQAYLTTDPTIRVRREDNTYYMTYKGHFEEDTPLAHSEENLRLTKESYETLKSKADGFVIKKKRILIPYSPSEDKEYTIELDIFEAPFEPLVLAEVEFNSVEEAEVFNPPAWFDVEVTYDKAYTNASLSRSGVAPK